MNILLNQLINKHSNFYEMVDAKYKDYLWNLRLINVESLWNKGVEYKLKQIKIAIIDSGIDHSHNDLKNIERQGFNFIDNSLDLRDDFGHGTKINGIIAGSRNGEGICGIASEANIFNLKVINHSGTGRVRNIIEAFRWSIENKMDIINMSIGHPADIDSEGDTFKRLILEERKIIREAIELGIVIVGAVGNVPGIASQVPACYEGVIPVASYGVFNTNPIKFYPSQLNSNYDSKTIFAPGEHILTTIKGNSYGYDSGSSMSAAHITGIVGYLKAMNNRLNSRQIHKILIETSSTLETNKSHINIVNTEKAIEQVELIVC